MFEFIAQNHWVELPIETRKALIKQFGIPRSGSSEVVGGRLMSDGYTQDDLRLITKERMQEFTMSSSNDFIQLYKLTVDKLLNNEPTPQTNEKIERNEQVNEPSQENVGKAVAGRGKKKTKKS